MHNQIGSAHLTTLKVRFIELQVIIKSTYVAVNKWKWSLNGVHFFLFALVFFMHKICLYYLGVIILFIAFICDLQNNSNTQVHYRAHTPTHTYPALMHAYISQRDGASHYFVLV